MSLSKEELKEILEDGPYAHGGYPRFFLAKSGECLCFKCVKEHEEREKEEWEEDCEEEDQWKIIGHDINWESLLFCDECNSQIETAYGVWQEDQWAGSEE
jgi:hypothetical protein